jgi:hypothetical protein
VTRTELLEKHRDINVHHDWWQPTYDAFADDMRLKGIRVDRIFFSGFSSQGDGACFEGRVSDWAVFLPTVGVTCPAVVALAKEHWTLTVEHRGRYYHERNTHFDIYMPSPEDHGRSYYGSFAERYTPRSWDADDIRTKAWLALLQQVDYDKLEEDMQEAFRDHMGDLHKRLEKEYDYLTSYEVVWESIRANGLDEELAEEEA